MLTRLTFIVGQGTPAREEFFSLCVIAFFQCVVIALRLVMDGVDGLYVGVPVQIGAGGVEKVVEIALDDADKAGLKVSVDAVKELLDACKAIDSSLA